ncbi:MAG: GNAT family N-acetyltransferase [Turicibacter sp.]|nr:GNAT family N-acetyltransferase [Turicibacter sp.]
MNLIENQSLIRLATMKDASLLCNWWNDGQVMAHAGFPKGLGLTLSQVENQLEINPLKKLHLFILEFEGSPIGEMNVRDEGDGIASIGIKICEEAFQSKGLGQVYLKLFLRWLFEEKSFRKIVLDTSLKNIRAQKAYEKVGFEKVGVRHQVWLAPSGEWFDVVDYELTKQNWKRAMEMKDNGLEIRLATVEDIPGIIRVCSEGVRHTEGSQNLGTPEMIEASILEYYHEERLEKEVQEISNHWNGYYVAVLDGKVVGAGGGGLHDATTSELYVLYLDTTLKRQGIGTHLLNAITADQKKRGATTQWVSVAKGNQMGIPFYEAKGFEFQEEEEEQGWVNLRYKRAI